jgi:hypothetical protein
MCNCERGIRLSTGNEAREKKSYLSLVWLFVSRCERVE